jgi:periplasmic divalent cation tolerance protein
MTFVELKVTKIILLQTLIAIILDSKVHIFLQIVMEYCSVYLTARDATEAKIISHTLVFEKLAACVNYFPIESIYRWKGNIEESGEMALIAKTRADLVEKVIQRVKQIHSYEIPCIVSWKIEKGNPDFLEWIKETTERE